MPQQNIDTVKQWFLSKKYPTQQQFFDFFDSILWKGAIAMADVVNLVTTLAGKSDKATTDAFEQGDLVAFNADGSYVIPAGYLLEKVTAKYGSNGTMTLSLVAIGDDDELPLVNLSLGWNKPIDVNIIAEANTILYISGIPNNSKILFLKRKLKMA